MRCNEAWDTWAVIFEVCSDQVIDPLASHIRELDIRCAIQRCTQWPSKPFRVVMQAFSLQSGKIIVITPQCPFAVARRERKIVLPIARTLHHLLHLLHALLRSVHQPDWPNIHPSPVNIHQIKLALPRIAHLYLFKSKPFRS